MLLCENVSTLLTPDVVRGRKEGCKEIFLTTGRGSYDTGGRECSCVHFVCMTVFRCI